MAPGPAGCRERQRDLKSAQRWELGPWEYNIFYWFMLHHLVQCDCGCRHLTAGTLVVPLALLLPPPGPPLLCSAACGALARLPRAGVAGPGPPPSP